MNYQAKCFSFTLLLSSTGLAAQQAAPRPVLTPTPPPQTGSTTQSPVLQAPVVASPVATPPVPVPVGTSTGQAAPVDPPRPSAQVDSSYVIGPEDAINVNVWKEPGFSGSLAVRPDGMISLPLLGDLPAAGSTPMQLSTDIATRLKKYVTDPLVTVTVITVNSKRIYMAGEVGHPGPLPLTPEMTPLQAIITAGGLGPYANPKKIYILRKVNGKDQKIPFNYKTALKTGNMQGVTLLTGDTIVVP